MINNNKRKSPEFQSDPSQFFSDCKRSKKTLDEKIERLKSIIDDPTFTYKFRETASNELKLLTEKTPISKIPLEILLQIFSFIPAENRTLSLVNKEFNVVADDSYYEHSLILLREKFIESGLSEDRLDTHIRIVTERLKERGEVIKNKNIFNELVAFQSERVPEDDVIKNEVNHKTSSSKITLDDFVAIEKIIKKYNYYLVADQLMPDELFEIKTLSDLDYNCEKFSREFPWEYYTDTYLELGEIDLTEIPSLIKNLGSAVHEINFSSNYISYIPQDCFVGLSSLQCLWLDNNEIRFADPVAKLTNLVELSLSNNFIGIVDPLSSLTNLQDLWMDDNYIESLSPLSSLVNLQVLSLTTNKIDELSPLSSLKKLKKLYLNGNKIKNIKPLANLKKLQVLCLDDNNIESLSPLSSLNNLLGLYLNDNLIQSLRPLSSLLKLQMLYVNNNQIYSLSFLSELMNLRELGLTGNYIESIEPLVKLINLELLILDNNQINTFTILAKLTNLTALSLRNNQIESYSDDIFSIFKRMHQLWLDGEKLSGEQKRELQEIFS